MRCVYIIVNNPKRISETISDMVKLFMYAERVYPVIKAAISEEDKLTQDLLHKIELGEGGSKERNKIATMLKVNRKDRRYYKDILEQIEPVYKFMNEKDNRRAFNYLSQVLGDVRKAEKYHQYRTYTPKTNRLAELEGEE